MIRREDKKLANKNDYKYDDAIVFKKKSLFFSQEDEDDLLGMIV